MAAGPTPPRALVLIADWGNVFAGLSLTISFFLILLNAYGAIDITDANTAQAQLQKWTMVAEGALYAIAGTALTVINVITNNAYGAVSQTIIAFGGIFFCISGFGFPFYVSSIRYIFPYDGNASLPDACPWYGISCFMFATSMGLYSVAGLPKKYVVSPFWGVTFFFLGAWTIGLGGLWIPLLAGGYFESDLASGGTRWMGQPIFKWAGPHIFQLFGSIFLTAGAVVFGLMDNFLCRSLPSREPMLDDCQTGQDLQGVA
mmetsp:Transcript_12403/g.23274  ORF Transcript_12403/g.23274 Transcript_12403/m.23274 type:complete len:259 (+) Transcript_12403:70-846(+)